MQRPPRWGRVCTGCNLADERRGGEEFREIGIKGVRCVAGNLWWSLDWQKSERAMKGFSWREQKERTTNLGVGRVRKPKRWWSTRGLAAEGSCHQATTGGAEQKLSLASGKKRGHATVASSRTCIRWWLPESVRKICRWRWSRVTTWPSRMREECQWGWVT